MSVQRKVRKLLVTDVYFNQNWDADLSHNMLLMVITSWPPYISS